MQTGRWGTILNSLGCYYLGICKLLCGIKYTFWAGNFFWWNSCEKYFQTLSCTQLYHAFSFIMYTVLSCIECHHAKSCRMYFVPSCIQFPGCVQLHSAFCTRTLMHLVKSCIWFHHAREMRHLHPSSICLATSAGCITVSPCISVVLHCKKTLAVFPSLAGISLTKLSLPENNLIIPGQGEFG